MAAKYLFTNSYELATGNWQPDANSILDGLRRLKLNRYPANASQVLIHLLLLIGNRQVAARCKFDATGSQMPIRF